MAGDDAVQGGPFRFGPGEPWRWLGHVMFVATSVRIAVTLVLALLVALVAGDALGRQVATIEARPGESFVTGVAAELLLPLAFVGLAVTLVVSIVGIPLLPLLPLLMLVVALVWVVGFAAATAAIGRGVLRTVGASEASLVLSVLVGAIPVFLLTVISRAVWVSSLGVPGWSIGVALGGVLVEWIAWTFGIGTLALTWMRRQGPSASAKAPVAPSGPPATPPLPVEL